MQKDGSPTLKHPSFLPLILSSLNPLRIYIIIYIIDNFYLWTVTIFTTNIYIFYRIFIIINMLLWKWSQFKCSLATHQFKTSEMPLKENSQIVFISAAENMPKLHCNFNYDLKKVGLVLTSMSFPNSMFVREEGF